MIKSFTDLATIKAKEENDERNRKRIERIERITAIRDNRVVAGVFTRKPVDRAAAMLVAKSDWPYLPPPTPKQKDDKVMTSINAMHTKGFHEDLPLRIGKEIIKATKINGEEGYYIKDIAEAFVKHLNATLDPDIMNIATKAMTCRETLEASTRDIASAMNDFDATIKAGVNDVRTKRMTIVSECASMVNAMRDVRQFFLGPDYEKEQKRLSEFVGLCERLKSLKDSGFLDTVADTMIRLASVDGVAQ